MPHGSIGPRIKLVSGRLLRRYVFGFKILIGPPWLLCFVEVDRLGEQLIAILG
jgi:hypothetical protein